STLSGKGRSILNRDGSGGVCGGGLCAELIVHGVLLGRGDQLLEVRRAGLGAGLLTSADEVGKRDGEKDTDDQDNDHDLDQRKTKIGRASCREGVEEPGRNG